MRLEADTAHATNGYDGGVLEIKIGTNAFTDIIAAGGSFVSNGYNRHDLNALQQPARRPVGLEQQPTAGLSPPR